MREVKLPLRKESIVCLATVLRSMPCETQYAFRNTSWLVDETLPGTPKGRSCVMTETPKPAAGPFSKYRTHALLCPWCVPFPPLRSNNNIKWYRNAPVLCLWIFWINGSIHDKSQWSQAEDRESYWAADEPVQKSDTLTEHWTMPSRMPVVSLRLLSAAHPSSPAR